MRKLSVRSFVKLLVICVVCLLVIGIAACGAGDGYNDYPYYPDEYGYEDEETKESKNYKVDGKYLFNETYNDVEEEKFKDSKLYPKSYFKMDSNTASYTNLRRYIENNSKLNGNIILTDELINYFEYDYQKPTGDETFAISTEVGTAPWNTEHKLLTIAITTKDAEVDETVRNNYVFLIDVSGSMKDDNKLPLIKDSLLLLLDKLSETDTLSIVTYAKESRLIVDGENPKSENLKAKINGLKASGGTAASGGLELAYEVAENHFSKKGNNRIILCTDGDFNIGLTKGTDLEKYISGKRDTGVYLTCLGFGMGNYNSTTMESLANNGNGGYAYIDKELEAYNIFINKFAKTMYTVAKDVKTCVEFNPNVVEDYRLIGYENKKLTEEEYNDEDKDSGEIGSGHTSVVCYELILKDGAIDKSMANVQIKYKDVKDGTSLEKNQSVPVESGLTNTDNYKFVSNLVWFSLILRSSAYVVVNNYQAIINNLKAIQSIKSDKDKQELIELVTIAKANNLVADEEYDKVRSIILYTPIGIEYIHVDKGTTLNKVMLMQIIGINMSMSNYVDFYLDDDYTELVTSFELKINTTIYMKVYDTPKEE